MYKFKRFLAVFMSVCLLSFTVGSTYFDAGKVDAAEVAVIGGLTASTLFEICLFVGAVGVGCYAAGEVIDNQEEIARAGKNFIDSITEIPQEWILSLTDISGQEYVFGSEALELVQDTAWEVIQGGAPNNNDDDNNDNDDKKGWLNIFSPSNQLVGSFTALGATWFIDGISNLYQKWVNGEELTDAEYSVIEPLVSGYCNQYDIADQWSGSPFDYSLQVSNSYNGNNGIVFNHYDLSCIGIRPVAAYFEVVPSNSNWHGISFFTVASDGRIGSFKLNGTLASTLNGSTSTSVYDFASVVCTENMKKPGNFSFSYSANFPVFSDKTELSDYLEGSGDIANALNYARIYRNADWLSDDWRGLLIDPLSNIALSLSQLIDLARALGVHAVGNALSSRELLDLLKKSLPAVNPELLPDEVPAPAIVPNPDLVPIYYPSPDAHPVPDRNPDVGTGDDPNPIPTPDEVLDIDNIVSDASGSFSGISGNLKNKFPFSLPWDIHYLFTVLADTPKAPYFEIPFYIERMGIREVVVIDLSGFDSVSKLSRLLLSLFFCYGLINLTVKIVSVRKDD